MKKLWCYLLLVAGAISALGQMPANADNFPLLRVSGEADAIGGADESYYSDFLPGPNGGIVTGTATVIPNIDEWTTVVEATANAAGLGTYPAGGATGYAGFEVLPNSTNSPYGGVLGMILTLASGAAEADAGVTVDHGGGGFDGISIQQTSNGVLVFFNGEPIDVSAGYGAPLEVSLPAAPGDYIFIQASAFVPASADSADQGAASASASVVPVDSWFLAKAVFRDFEGNIISSWEADPPPPPGDGP